MKAGFVSLQTDKLMKDMRTGRSVSFTKFFSGIIFMKANKILESYWQMFNKNQYNFIVHQERSCQNFISNVWSFTVCQKGI